MDKLGWHEIQNEVGSDGKPTPLAIAAQRLVDNGCDCDEDQGDGNECDGHVFGAALKSQFDENATLRAQIEIGRAHV